MPDEPRASWDDWILPIQNYLIGIDLADREIDEILSFISATNSTHNCPLLLDDERATIQKMIPLERQSTSDRVRSYMIDPVTIDQREES